MMRKFPALFLLASAAILLGGAAAPEGRPVLRAVVRPARTLEGDLVAVDVRAERLRNAAAVAFHLVFDPTRLAPVASRFSEGGLLKSDGARTQFLASAASTGDRLLVGVTRLGAGKGVSGNGLVARLVFRALKPGATAVGFDEAQLTGPGARPLHARFMPGKLIVQARKKPGRGR